METVSGQQEQVRPRGRRGKIGRKAGKRIGDVLTFAILLIFGVIFVGPFLWMVTSSLKSQWEVYVFPPTIFPEVPQWMNYVSVFQNQPFGLYTWNSFYISICSTLGVLLTSSLAGYSFSRIRYPGRDKIFMLYLSTMMVPGAVTLIPSFVMMKTFGWLDTHYPLIIPGMVGAWGTFMMRQFMLTIPGELEDAARIDGCSRFKIYWKIILPISQPAIATLAIFTFMGAWNSYLWPLIVIDTREKWTLPLGLANFQSRYAYMTPYHLIMAASFICVLPVMILFMVGQKYYVQGIVTTGLKGTA